MSLIVSGGYVSSRIPNPGPITQIQPFTYEDGVTFVELLADIRRYIVRVLEPYLKELGLDVDAKIEALIKSVDEALDAQTAEVDDKLEAQDQEVESKLTAQNAANTAAINALTTYVNEQVQLIIEDSIQVQDPVVAGLMGDEDSATRVVADTVYTPLALTSTGRLSETNVAVQIARETMNGQTMAIAGDSIGARNGPYTSSVGAYTPANGWWNWVNAGLGRRFNIVSNFSVAGKRVDEILNEQIPMILAMNPLPAYASVNGIANDLVQNRTSAAIVANLDTMFNTLNDAGITVITPTVAPLSGLTTAQRTVMYATNDWLKDVALKRKGVIIIDWFGEMSDAFGNPLTDTLVPDDNVHPSVRGAARMASAYIKTLDPLIPKTNLFPLPGSPSNAALNPFKLTGTGGILDAGCTGVVVQDYRAASADAGSVTAVLSVAARTDGIPGQWQEVVVSAGNFRLSTGQIPAAPGQVWEAYQEVVLEGIASSTLTRVSLTLSTVGSVMSGVDLGPNPNVADGMGVTLTSLAPNNLLLKTPQITTPGNTTALIAHAQLFGTTNAAKVKLGRIWVRRIS